MLKLFVNSLFFNLHINLAFRWVTNTHLLRLHCANACPSLLCFLASDDHSDHSCPCTYPPLYKHTKRSFESIQKVMPLLCYKLPSKCHGSQKNIQSWFWGRRHVGWGPCTLCLCFFFMFVSLSLHLHSVHPSNRSGQWFFPQPGMSFPSLCKVFYFLDRKLIETLLLLPLVRSPFPGSGVRRCGGKDTDFKQFQCKKLFIVKGLGFMGLGKLSCCRNVFGWSF